MEAGSKMGQVGYVSRKMSDTEIFKENNKIAVDDKVPKTLEKSEACDVNDGIPVGPEDFSKNFYKEDVIYSADFMNFAKSEAEDENIVSEDYIREIRKDQEKSTEVKNLTGEIEKYIGVLTSSENIDTEEINKISEDKKEENYISTLSKTKNGKHERLSAAACEKKVSVASLIKSGASKYSAAEQDVANNLAEKSIFSENEENKIHSEHTSKITTDEDHLSKRVKSSNNIEVNDTKANDMVMDTSSFMSEKLTDEKRISSNDVNDFEDILTKTQDEALIKDVILSFILTKNHCNAPSERERTEDIASLESSGLNLTSSERKIDHIPAMFLTLTEEKGEREILTRENSSQALTEKEKKELFICTAQDVSSTLEGNEELQVSQGGCRYENVNSELQFKGKKDFDLSPKIMPMKYEAGRGIEDHLSSIRADTDVFNGSGSSNDLPQVMIEIVNDLDLSSSSEYECIECLDSPGSPTSQESLSQSSVERNTKQEAKYEAEKDIKDRLSPIRANTEELKVIRDGSECANDIPQVILEVVNDFDLSSSLSEYECIECLDSQVSPTSANLSQSSLGRKLKEDLGFTPRQMENTHNLAMLSTPSPKSKDGNEISRSTLYCESCDKTSTVACSPIQLAGEKEQLSYVSNNSSPEYNEHIGISTDYICSECRNHEEKNKNLSSFQAKVEKEYAEKLNLLRSDDEKRIVKNPKSYERDKKVLITKNSMQEKTNSKQDRGNKITSTDCNSRKVIVNVPNTNKYGQDTKERNQKCAPFRKPEFEFRRINSSTSHSSNEEAFEIPSDALAEKIVSEAEFYFSDFNLMKNNFILKHIRRNKEGYLSVKLVSSYRKIKSLTRDWRVVAYSLEGSKLLQLNAEKNKVRRIEKIPRVQDTSYGKTVMAFNLPVKNTTAEDIKELFSKFGVIVTAEILTTRSPSYNIYHKRCRYFNQELLSNKFGVVEFKKYADALAAIKDEESHLPKENKMKVVPLLPLKYRSDAKNNRITSTTSLSSSRSNQERNYKPRSEVPRSRQVLDAKFTENRPPIADKYYRGSNRPRYEWKPQSHIDVRGKLPNDRIHGKVYEGEKNYYGSKQLGFSNALNIIPFHQQYRGPGRNYAFPRYQE